MLEGGEIDIVYGCGRIDSLIKIEIEWQIDFCPWITHQEYGENVLKRIIDPHIQHRLRKIHVFAPASFHAVCWVICFVSEV